MILKKPYAFLIKHFRTIHVILTILAIFICYKCGKIVGFFNEYIANNYSVTVTDTLISDYFGAFLYISVVLVIIALIVIIVILNVKKKPSKTYILGTIYYFILLIFLIFAAFLFKGLSTELWPTANARTYRDIAQLVYYPGFIFIIIVGIRALGFNVKQFNFKNDLKELEITEADSEEIEVNINFDTYKAKRLLRRLKRELAYYFKENKLLIIIICVILLGVGAYYGYRSYEKVNFNYNENDIFGYNNLSLNVKESMISNIGEKGNILYPDKYFVVIKLYIRNNNKNADIELDYNNLKLYYGEKFSYPSLDLGTYFKDYGDPFSGAKIKAGDEKTVIIPYMIDKAYKDSEFLLTLYLGSSTKKDEFLAKTANVKLKPAILDDLIVVREANLNDVISFASTAIGESSITIKNALFNTRYEYNYESCYNDYCRTYTDVVVADNTYLNRQALVVMDYELNLDKNTSSYKNINGIATFSNSFMQLEYKYNDNYKISDIEYVTPPKLKNKIVLQAPGEVLNSSEVNLLITIRNKRYSIKLK